MSLTEKELARALQYSGSQGIPEFIDWLVGLQEFNHGRKRGEGWDLCFGTGSSDLIYKVSARVAPMMTLDRRLMLCPGCPRAGRRGRRRAHRGSRICVRLHSASVCMGRR